MRSDEPRQHRPDELPLVRRRGDDDPTIADDSDPLVVRRNADLNLDEPEDGSPRIERFHDFPF